MIICLSKKTTGKKVYLAQTAEENFAPTARQSYIGFGLTIALAAELKVDSTPIEVFSSPELDKLPELEPKGLKSVTMLSLAIAMPRAIGWQE